MYTRPSLSILYAVGDNDDEKFGACITYIYLLKSLKKVYICFCTNIASYAPVAFTAQAHRDAECVEDEPVYFNRTLVDSGDNYVEENSTFVAPSDGLYLFMLRCSADSIICIML